MMNKENIDSNHDTDIVPEHLLKHSNILSWDEQLIIEFIRNNPDEKEKLFQQITNK